MKYSIDSKIKDLLAADEELRNRFDAIAPGLVTHPKVGMFKNFTLRACANIIPKQLTPEVLAKVEALFDEENKKNGEA